MINAPEYLKGAQRVWHSLISVVTLYSRLRFRDFLFIFQNKDFLFLFWEGKTASGLVLRSLRSVAFPSASVVPLAESCGPWYIQLSDMNGHAMKAINALLFILTTGQGKSVKFSAQILEINQPNHVDQHSHTYFLKCRYFTTEINLSFRSQFTAVVVCYQSAN